MSPMSPPIPIIAFITSPRFDSESRRNCADVTTRCPGSTPARTSTYSSPTRPVSISCGMRRPPPMSTKTTDRSPVRITAELGTVSAVRLGVVMRTVAYMPGLSRPSEFATAMRALIVRDSSCSVG